jgi:hypothetical protein
MLQQVVALAAKPTLQVEMARVDQAGWAGLLVPVAQPPWVEAQAAVEP